MQRIAQRPARCLGLLAGLALLAAISYGPLAPAQAESGSRFGAVLTSAVATSSGPRNDDYRFAPVFLSGGTSEACAADVDGSGEVDVSDLLEVLANWGSCPGCAADIDGNGLVDVSDLLAVLAAWGPCP